MDSPAPKDGRSVLPCTNAESASLQRIHHEVGQAFLEELQCLVKQPLRLDATSLRIVHNCGTLERESMGFSRHQRSFIASAGSTGIVHNVTWICPAVTAAYFLDALLGGGRYLPPPLTRPFTDIEHGLLDRVASLLWKHVETHWSTLTAMQLEPQDINREDFLIEHDATGDSLLIVRWNLSSQHARATMLLAYSWTDIQRMFQHRTVAANAELDAPIRREETQALRPSTLQPVSKIQMDWAYTSLPWRDAQNLEVGDLLITDAPPDALVRIFVNGRFDLLGKLCDQAGQLSIKIENIRSVCPE